MLEVGQTYTGDYISEVCGREDITVLSEDHDLTGRLYTVKDSYIVYAHKPTIRYGNAHYDPPVGLSRFYIIERARLTLSL